MRLARVKALPRADSAPLHCVALLSPVLACGLCARYCTGNQGHKNERNCLRPLSGEARHKNANLPSEGGYERVGKYSQVEARGECLSGKDSVQKRHWVWEGGMGVG